MNVTTAGSVGTSLGIAVGNTLEGVVAFSLLTRVKSARDLFMHVKGIFAFVGLAALASTTVGATVGVTSLALGGHVQWERYGDVWLTWWLGDATGALLVTPPIVLWALPPYRYDHAMLVKSLLTFIGLVVVSLVLFAGWPALDSASLSTLVSDSSPSRVDCLLARPTGNIHRDGAPCCDRNTRGTLHGNRPLFGQSNESLLLLLQAFLGMISLTSFCSGGRRCRATAGTLRAAAVDRNSRRAREGAHLFAEYRRRGAS